MALTQEPITFPPERLPITVTQGDINAGEPATCHSCPIALAATRAIHDTSNQEIREITVFNYDIAVYFVGQKDAINYELPEEATAFITAFDARRETSPLTFTARQFMAYDDYD